MNVRNKWSYDEYSALPLEGANKNGSPSWQVGVNVPTGKVVIDCDNQFLLALDDDSLVELSNFLDSIIKERGLRADTEWGV